MDWPRCRLRRDSAADLCPVVRILVEEQGRDAGDERIRLRLPEAAVLSDLDPDALAIILRNLIDNALRHGDPAKPVDVTLTSEGILRVSNDGLSIPPETLARLATRFTRAGSSADSGKDNFDLRRLLPNELHRIYETGRDYDSRPMLIIMKDRNLHRIFQRVFYIKALRRLHILQIDTAECRL